MRDEILSAASELLRNHGPSRVTARAICDAAGVKAPTLYHYFGDLDGLYHEVVRAAFAECISRNDLSAREDQGLDGLRQAWDDWIRFCKQEPTLFAIVVRQMASESMPPEAIDYFGHFKKFVEGIARTERLRYDVPTTVRIVWCACMGEALSLYTESRGLTFGRSKATALRELVLTGILVDANRVAKVRRRAAARTRRVRSSRR